MTEELLTVMAAANYLGVSREKLSRLIRTGKLSPSINELDSRERLIPKSQLDALIPNGMVVSRSNFLENVQEKLVEPVKSQAKNLVWLFAGQRKEENTMATATMPLKPVKQACSFCNKPAEDVFRLVAGPNRVYICDACVRLAQVIIDEEKFNSNQEQS